MPPLKKPKKSGGTGSRTHALSVVQEFMKESYYAGRRGKEKEGEARKAGEKVAQELEAEVNEYMEDTERRKATMQELKELCPKFEELFAKIADAEETTDELCEFVNDLEEDLLERTDGRFLKVGAELHQLRERIQALQLENEQLERNLQSSSSATEKEALEKTITSLRADVEAKERTAQLCKPELEKLKKNVDSEKERVGRRNETIAQWRKKCENLHAKTNEEKATIRKEKSALETQALELNQRIREQDEALKDSRTRLEDCETSKGQLEESLTEMKTSIATLSTGIHQLNSTNRLISEKLDSSTKENSDLEVRLQEANLSNRKYSKKEKELSAEVLRLKYATTENDTLNRRILDVRLKLSEQTTRELKVYSEKEDLENQVLELRSQVDSVLEGEQSAREQAKKYSDRHTQAKRQVKDLEQQLSSARKEINDLKEKRTRDEYALKVSRAETRLARDLVERMRRVSSTPTPFPVVQTNSRTSGPSIEVFSSHDGPRLSTLPVIQEDEETEEPGLSSTPESSSLQPQTPMPKDKVNVRAKRHQKSAETMAEARRLLNKVVFETGENEFSISAFPDDVQTNFANAISNVLDDYRPDVVAYNLKPNRIKCLSCTGGTRSCESGDGDFTCNWCESNASLCITRTEGTLFVAPRVQEETMDPKSERYWLSGPRLKRRRRTGLELLA